MKWEQASCQDSFCPTTNGGPPCHLQLQQKSLTSSHHHVAAAAANNATATAAASEASAKDELEGKASN